MVNISEVCGKVHATVNGIPIEISELSVKSLVAIYYLWSGENERQSMTFKNKTFAELLKPESQPSDVVCGSVVALERDLKGVQVIRRGGKFSISNLRFDENCPAAQSLMKFLNAK